MTRWNQHWMRWSLAACLSFGLALGAPAAWAQTPDGETPAVENACDGFSGKVYGLCNAYCEAMDCDAEAPQASDQACTRVFDKIVAANEGPFAFCGDQDGDGVPSGSDNCPAWPNPGQEDGDGNGTGDACEPDACPCFGSPGFPGDLADAISDAAEWRQSHPPADDSQTLCITAPSAAAYIASQDGLPIADTWTMSVGFNFQQGAGTCTLRRSDDHTLPNTFATLEDLASTDEAGQCQAAAKALQSDDPLDICTSP